MNDIEVEVSPEKNIREARIQRSAAARSHRKEVKAIKAIRELKEEREEEHLYQKHIHLMQDQKKI